jgi:hypothetical protein
MIDNVSTKTIGVGYVVAAKLPSCTWPNYFFLMKWRKINEVDIEYYL